MEAKNFEMQLIFEIGDCTLYDISQPGKLKLVNSGTLAIYELQSHSLILLKLADWQYSLSKEVPVMAQQEGKRKMYALPKQKGNFGLVLGPFVTDEQQNVLESIFYSHSEFVISTPGGDEPNNGFSPTSNVVEGSIPKQEVTTSKKIQGFLQKGGDLIREGLIAGAGFLASGIQSGGKYIRSKISKPKQTEIKPETMAKVKMVKAGSSAILVFTQAQIGALIQGAKTVGSEIANQVGSSETGQKIQQHKNYEDVKNVAKGTVHALAAVYDGMFEGLCAIGRGFQGATTNVVEGKYGKEAGELAHESFETAANVGNIAQAYKTEAIKAVKDGTQSKIVSN